MPYIHDWSDPLDVVQAPFRALSAPWQALQTGVATGDIGQAGQALLDPDKAIHGRQFLEQMGIINPSSGVVGDIAGMATDLADPLSWLAMGGLGKAYQAVRGARAIGGAAEAAAPVAKGIGGWMPTARQAAPFALPLAGAAVEGYNSRQENPNAALQTIGQGMMLAPLAMVLGGKALPHEPVGPEHGLPIYSRLNNAVETLPESIKAQSLMNTLKKAPGGVSAEELGYSFPPGSVPPSGVMTKDQVRDIVQNNGIAIERRTFGGASQEGMMASAARERYLAAEQEYQKQISTPAGAVDYRIPDSAFNAERARNAAYAEMNRLAGHSDEWVKAKQELDAANKAHDEALDSYVLPPGFKMNAYGHGTYAVEGPTGRSYRQSSTRAGAVGNAIDIAFPRSSEFDAIAERQANAQSTAYALDNKSSQNQPRYSTYATPGGKNYMERLIKLPDPGVQLHQAYATKEGLRNMMYRKYGNGWMNRMSPEDSGAWSKAVKDSDDAEAKIGSTYHSDHWPGDPNVAAHWRADDRVGDNGEKVLHVQEVQSDWHQAIRDRGATPEENASIIDGIKNKQQSHLGQQPVDHEGKEWLEWNKKYMKLGRQLDTAEKGPINADEPLYRENRWSDLALKDIMDHALKGGYDAISFNNGKLAKQYSAGGGGDIKGLTDWYERQLPQRMQKLFGLKSEPKDVPLPTAEVNQGWGRIGGDKVNVPHTLPYFKLSPNQRQSIASKGAPLLSIGPLLAALGLAGYNQNES